MTSHWTVLGCTTLIWGGTGILAEFGLVVVIDGGEKAEVGGRLHARLDHLQVHESAPHATFRAGRPWILNTVCHPSAMRLARYATTILLLFPFCLIKPLTA